MSFITIGGNRSEGVPASPQAFIMTLVWAGVKFGAFIALAVGLYYAWAGRIEDKALQQERHQQVTRDLAEKEKQIKRLEDSQALTRAAMENLAKGSETIRKQTAQRFVKTDKQVQGVIEDQTKSEDEKDKEISRIYATALREQQCTANPMSCKPAPATTGASRYFNLQQYLPSFRSKP